MLFGFSFGSSESESESFGTTKSDTTVEKESIAESEKTSSETVTGQQDQTVSQLDEETQTLLTDLIQKSGGLVGTTSEELSQFANDLAIRGAETEAVLNENIDAILAESRRAGEKQIGQLQTQLGTAAGSTQNSFVAGATAEASAELESRLAGQAGELGIAARAAGGKDLLDAFSALAQVPGAQAQEGANVVNLVNALKGATTTSTGTTVQDTVSDETLSTLEQVLQEITSSGTSFNTGSQSGSNVGFNLSI